MYPARDFTIMNDLHTQPALGLPPVARFSHITKVYDDEGLQVKAIDDITFDLPRQRFATIIGPSGSGKTTLLNLIGCIDTPSSGRVEVCGQDIGSLSEKALTQFRASHIAFVFQNFNLLPVLSAYENVEYPLLLLQMPAAERHQRVTEMLDAVGLADKASHRPNQLSGGQKQRVAIARALVKRPSLVLADEPTANLDSQTGAAIIALMRRVQHEHGATFIFSTHDPQLISHAEETYYIRDGRLVEHQSKGTQ
jgi:putative ABC transport system ATP-binding protein